MMHIAISPYFHKIHKFSPVLVELRIFLLNLRFFLPPILTMMHLCIMLYTYWTPLNAVLDTLICLLI